MITMDYYGFRDEDDGSLLIKEAEAEGKAIEQEVAAWQERGRGGVVRTGDNGGHVLRQHGLIAL